MSDKPGAPTLATLTQHILNECLYSVIHSLVLDIHTSETALRRTCDPKTQLPLCPSCGLPRLLEPPLATSRPDKSTQYCSHVPWARQSGHDIYGNPFPVAGSDKPPTKKEREARAKAEAKRKDSSKGGRGDDDDDAPNIAGGPIDKKAAKVGERLKGGTYVPWHTCPSCKRSLLITRFAQHLEKCLGIGGRGRAAARNGGTGTGSPASGAGGSRGGTPVGNKDRDDSDDDEGMRKKVLKKGLKREGKLAAPKDKSKLLRLSGDGKDKRPRADEDDDDDDATPLRKKAKLVRQPSMASVMSSATAQGSFEGDESVEGDADGDAEGDADGEVDVDGDADGSFVDHDEEEEEEEEED